MPSNHLFLFCPLLHQPSIFPSIRVFSNQSALHIRWPECWSFSFNISPSSEYSGLISFRVDCCDLLADHFHLCLKHASGSPYPGRSGSPWTVARGAGRSLTLRGPVSSFLGTPAHPLQLRWLPASSPWARPAPARALSLLIPVRRLLCTQLSLRLPSPLPVDLWPDVIVSTFRVETPTCKSILVFFLNFSSPEHLSVVGVLCIFLFYLIYCCFFPLHLLKKFSLFHSLLVTP